MVLLLFLVAVGILAAGYAWYGRFLARELQIDPNRVTPAVEMADGRDHVPAPRAVLLGHHFSSIAGAGPIVGPIVAAKAFGWAPALIWIVVGSIFIGGVHDLTSLVASLRHKARSIAEIVRLRMSTLSYRLFLAFIWFALVYVLTVFVDLTAATFVTAVPIGPDVRVPGGAVATSSMIYIVLALVLGLLLQRFNVRTLPVTMVFVPLVFVAIAVGVWIPIEARSVPVLIGGDASSTWKVVLIGYCLVASMLPVWLLLQPRDYLSSFLLYACVAGGLLGLLVGGGQFTLHFPAFRTFEDQALGLIFPALFINIACGACSGFHSIVASGTTSKQLRSEADAVPIAYGSMIVEGVIAVIAVMTLVTTLRDDPALGSPTLAFAAGLGRFLAALGIPQSAGAIFGLLAVSTFLLTTLDTATRLGRYVFEEFLEGFMVLSRRALRLVASVVTVAVPLALSLVQLRGPDGALMASWKVIWPVFGATNQLLAALTLMVVTVWLTHLGRRRWYVAWPMVIMLLVSLAALVQLMAQHGATLIGVIAGGLMVLALLLVVEGGRVLWRARA